MTKPMIRIHNCETNEIIDREMTDVEFAQHEKDLAKRIEELAEAEAKASAKAALLERLGMTQTEADLLLS
jgi:hypothetical protein